MISRLFITALWLPAGKGLNSWLSFVMLNCVFITFQSGVLGQVMHVIVSIHDLCTLSYFQVEMSSPPYISISAIYIQTYHLVQPK